MLKKLGIIGTGMLGTAVAKRLLEKKYQLFVYNRTKKNAEPLQAHGATICDSPKQVALSSDLIFTVLKDDQATHQMSFGNQGLVEGNHDGLVVADMSTINPKSTKILANLFIKHKISFLDTPVMGGPHNAEKGELLMMVGGNKTIFESNEQIFRDLANQIFFIGENGAGHAIKLAMNLQITLIALSIAEGITLTKGFGLDPKIFLDVLNSTYFKTGTSQIKAYKMIQGDFTPSFKLENLKKDLEEISEACGDYGISLEIMDKAKQIYSKATEMGLGNSDYTGILSYFEKLNKFKKV